MTAALLLAWLLWEPGAPALPQRLHRAAVVGQACAAEGLDPAECVAMAWVESRLKTKSVSKAGCVGMMQVCSTNKATRRKLLDIHYNATAGARKLAACREEFGANRWRCYACTPGGARRGAPGCLRHERLVREVYRRFWWLFGPGGEA